jgi:hypothetical protein
MAHFDDLTTTQQVSGIGSAHQVLDAAADARWGLEQMVKCANLLFEKMTAREIKFAPGVPGAMLEMMGVLLLRAAHLPEAKRAIFFECWAKEGTEKIKQIIGGAQQRGGLVAPDDLAVFLRCIPPDGD